MPANTPSGFVPRSSIGRAVVADIFRVAIVQRSFVINGRPYLDCWDPESGAQWMDVPVISQGGGGANSYASVPASTSKGTDDDIEFPRNPEGTGAAQVLLGFYHLRRRPIALGYIPSVDARIIEQTPEDVADTEDHPATPARQDFAFVNGDTKVIFDTNGAVTIDTQGSDGKHIRLQLPGDGILRISRDGSATERLALGGAVTSAFGDVVARINQISLAVEALDTAVGGLQMSPEGPAGQIGFSHSDLEAPTGLSAAATRVSSDSE